MYQASEVFILTKQLVLSTTSSTPLVQGVFSSFYKATKSISAKWTLISEAQWAYVHNNIHYVVTKHSVQ